MNRQRGVALLWVLWILVLGTSILLFSLQQSATHQAFAALGRRQSQSLALAHAGFAYAAQQLSQAPNGVAEWLPKNRRQEWQWQGTKMQIDIDDESGKIDINNVSQEDLARYFSVKGFSETRSLALAAAIVDYRDEDDTPTGIYGLEVEQYQGLGLEYPANRPFSAVTELQRIPGLTASEYQAIEADLSIDSVRAVPDTAWASAAVAQTFPHGLGAATASSGLYRIHVQLKQAKTPAHLQAVIQISPADAAGRRYRVLSWQQGIGESY